MPESTAVLFPCADTGVPNVPATPEYSETLTTIAADAVNVTVNGPAAPDVGVPTHSSSAPGKPDCRRTSVHVAPHPLTELIVLALFAEYDDRTRVLPAAGVVSVTVCAVLNDPAT